MTNWALIGPSTGVLQAKVNTTGSTSELTVNKSTDGGAWVEYSASWPETTNRLRVATTDKAHSGREGGIDISVGGAGSERVILPLPRPDYGGDIDVARVLTVPITIRAGERVAIRPESAASVDVAVSLSGWMDPLFRTDFRYADKIGVVSQSAFVAPDPGGTADTKGSYAQLLASTANNYKSIVVVLCNMNSSNATDVDSIFDLAIGAAASEVIIIPDMWAHKIGRLMDGGTALRSFDIGIPAGVRIAARCASENITVGERDQTGIAILGLY